MIKLVRTTQTARSSLRRLARSHFKPYVASILGAALAATIGTFGISGAGAATAKTSTINTVVSELKTILTINSKPSQFTPPGPAINAKKARGKSVFMVASATQLPFTQELMKGAQEAAAASGLTLTIGDAQNQTTEAVRLIQNAISSRVKAIILVNVEPETVAGALQQAKAAHIPTVVAFQGDPSLPTAQEKSQFDMFANLTYCYSCMAGLVADYAIVELRGNVHAMMTWDPSAPSTVALRKGFAAQLTKYCPKTCTVNYVNTPEATAFQDTAAAAQAAVQNPQMNFIFPQYDAYIAAVLPAITSGNATNRVSVGSDNADLAQMQQMENGTPVKVDIGSPVAWAGWGLVDQALRAIVGTAPARSENLPIRVFDTANVGEFNLAVDPGFWYGATNYRNDYLRLWGLKK